MTRTVPKRSQAGRPLAPVIPPPPILPSEFERMVGPGMRKRRHSPGPADAVFDTPEREFPPVPPMRDGFAKIVRRIYDEGVDVEAEYDAIEKALNLEGALTPGAIKAQAAKAEEMARRAYRLYLLARFEYEAYMRVTDVRWGAIRDAARGRLEGDKKIGARTKQVTDADVASEAAMAFPDEWSDICDRRERAKGMRDMVEKLATLAEKRCFSVSRLLEPGTGRV